MPIYIFIGLVLLIGSIFLLVLHIKSVRAELEQVQKEDQESHKRYIDPIYDFILTNRTLDAVNNQRSANGRIELDYDTTEKIVSWRQSFTPEQLIDSAPGKKIERVESMFDFLVFYELSVESSGTTSRDTLIDIMKKDARVD